MLERKPPSALVPDLRSVASHYPGQVRSPSVLAGMRDRAPRPGAQWSSAPRRATWGMTMPPWPQGCAPRRPQAKPAPFATPACRGLADNGAMMRAGSIKVPLGAGAAAVSESLCCIATEQRKRSAASQQGSAVVNRCRSSAPRALASAWLWRHSFIRVTVTVFLFLNVDSLFTPSHGVVSRQTWRTTCLL